MSRKKISFFLFARGSAKFAVNVGAALTAVAQNDDFQQHFLARRHCAAVIGTRKRKKKGKKKK
jgi:hypothetical protein